MTKSAVFALLIVLLAGCKDQELEACSTMCKPNLVLKYENDNCYCMTYPPPPDAGK